MLFMKDAPGMILEGAASSHLRTDSGSPITTAVTLYVSYSASTAFLYSSGDFAGLEEIRAVLFGPAKGGLLGLQVGSEKLRVEGVYRADSGNAAERVNVDIDDGRMFAVLVLGQSGRHRKSC